MAIKLTLHIVCLLRHHHHIGGKNVSQIGNQRCSIYYIVSYLPRCTVSSSVVEHVMKQWTSCTMTLGKNCMSSRHILQFRLHVQRAFERISSLSFSSARAIMLLLTFVVVQLYVNAISQLVSNFTVSNSELIHANNRHTLPIIHTWYSIRALHSCSS